jgi:hypothetical protein
MGRRGVQSGVKQLPGAHDPLSWTPEGEQGPSFEKDNTVQILIEVQFCDPTIYPLWLTKSTL